MVHRNKLVLECRPHIDAALVTLDMSKEEIFQNEVLRPILKFQHDLLCAYVSAQVAEKRGKYHELNDIEKIKYLDRVIWSDPKIKQTMMGMIIGHFTVEELSRYQLSVSEYKRRILTMMKARIASSINAHD